MTDSTTVPGAGEATAARPSDDGALRGVPGHCFDIDGNWWNKHGPGSGCPDCDPPARATVPGASSEGERPEDYLVDKATEAFYRAHIVAVYHSSKGREKALANRDAQRSWRPAVAAAVAAALRVAPPSEPGLDAAWAEAESALPEGGWVVVAGNASLGYNVSAYVHSPFSSMMVDTVEVAHATAGPLIDALHDLAARLGEGPSRGPVDHLASKDRSADEQGGPKRDPSDCPNCGEWRDSPDADCASCGFEGSSRG